MKPCPEKCDRFPSKIILNNIDLFAPILTRIINASLTHNLVPTCLKTVCVTPIPKKTNVDHKDPSNLRPITNVTLILKLLDKIATAQFQEYIDYHNLLHIGQSGFRRGYSTETAMLQLITQLRHGIEDNKATLLILLDLSAAYDLVDHKILIERLKTRFLCSQEAADWLLSFLTDRKSKITWDTAESPEETIHFGVPQGSCISPALFNTYLSPLFSLLEEQGVQFTNYADDTQLLLELSGDHPKDNQSLNDIIQLVKTWMDENWMCLNGSKTELIIISTKQKRLKLGPQYNSFSINQIPIQVADTVKTLGVTLDSSLSMTPHCDKLYNSTQYHLKILRGIRPVLTDNHCASIARAVIGSRLDYCNALLANTSKANTSKLQLIQNSAVRIISNIPRRDHITAARQALHWLPITKRIEFKIISLTHKCLTGKAPSYLAAHIKPLIQERNLRSSNTGLLACPKSLKVSGDRRSFTHLGPSMWNALPTTLRLEPSQATFKKKLKTLLFC